MMTANTRILAMTVSILGAIFRVPASPAMAQGCPELLGWWPHGPAHAVTVSNTTAYVGAGAAVIVVDVSAPAMPVPLGFVQLPSVVEDVAVDGTHAHLALGSAGLSVVDVSVPAARAPQATPAAL
jgi:hypothetical protein